jgi:hypothetical protein
MYGIEGEEWQSLLIEKFNEILTTGQEEITNKIQEAYEMGVRASGLEEGADGTYTVGGPLLGATSD